MKKLSSIDCEKCEKRKESIFCDLSKSDCEQMDTHKTTNLYKSHQVVFYEGNHPYGLYCVYSGKVKIYKTDPDGNQRIVRLAGTGDILGYRCLLSNEPYTATAETLEDTTICFIDKTTFMELIQRDPKSAANLMNLLARDLGNAEKQMLYMAHRSIRERFAELLILLKNKYGRQIKEGFYLDISLSRQEMAELVGTTQESLIRLISDFKKENILQVKGRQISIVDLSQLIELANLPD